MEKQYRASSSSMDSPILNEFDFEILDELEGLSHWEFIDSSDADSIKHITQIEDGGGDEDEEDVVSDETADGSQNVVLPVISLRLPLVEYRIEDDRDDLHEKDRVEYDYDGNHYEDDGDDDADYDLDDELVPWSVSGKFERQRMRKLGKRGFTRMYNSKRSPYLFVRPGCVRGKHGLGLKHNY